MTDTRAQQRRNLSTLYADPALLLARQSSPAAGAVAEEFADWVLGRLGACAGLDILDAGAGVGRFTARLTKLADAPHSVVALDLFSSMLETVRRRAQPGARLALVNGDIAQLPFSGSTFDLVLANHVLYHLADISPGLAELARVLRPAGRLVATANAVEASVPVLRLHREIVERTGCDAEPEASPFSLENGADILAAHFPHVDTHVFTATSHYASERALVDAYATTGRCRLIAETLGRAAVLELAGTVASEWFAGSPDGIFGEVRMAAFIGTDARPAG